MAKRDIIIESIMAGGATKESLMEAAEVDSKGLASQFTYMRLMGKCPVVNPDSKEFSIVTAEEWETIKEERASNSTATSKLTPEERLEKAEKSSEKATKAFNTASERANKDEDNEKLDLRLTIADATLKLRQIEVDEAEAAVETD